MNFEHCFCVKAPIQEVARFHHNASSMAAITPPPLIVQMHESPESLYDGARMRFSIWIGPLRIRWLAEMESISDTGFIDHQLDGPFASWTHEHRFVALSPNETEVTDRIEAALHRNLWMRFIGLSMWLSLPTTFAYRGWRTRRILEQAPHRAVPGSANGSAGDSTRNR